MFGYRSWGFGCKRWPAVMVGVICGLACSIGGPGTAMAAEPTCPTGFAMNGRGSSLQRLAQFGVWAPGYEAACPTGAPVSYESTGDGSGLSTFGFKGGAINQSFQYVATDFAPHAVEITNAEEAAGGVKPIIVPVAQTAIAVVVHPPEGCKFAAGTGITWGELNKAFGGSAITTWKAFMNATGAGCSSPITRVVRSEWSAVTLQFKNYLSRLETSVEAEGLPCTVEGHTRWSELEQIGVEGKPNTVWPECAGSSPVIRANGEFAVAEKVIETPGTIGYTTLPAAAQKGAATARLQNGKASGKPTYAEPMIAESKAANCNAPRYTVPVEGRPGTGSGEAVDWAEVFGAEPQIGGVSYPLCMLTYDIGWSNYAKAGYNPSGNWGESVRDYLGRYVVQPGLGQAGLKSLSYFPLPASASANTNVQAAAEFAAEQIG
jgi:ABC-type phosphate transport system substrate-binding protein